MRVKSEFGTVRTHTEHLHAQKHAQGQNPRNLIKQARPRHAGDINGRCCAASFFKRRMHRKPVKNPKFHYVNIYDT